MKREKMMKKFLIVLFAMASIFTLTGCGADESIADAVGEN